MSGILKRTVFADTSDGYVRPLDWAVVVTEIGQMVEPKTGWFTRKSTQTPVGLSDDTDMISMVNEIKNFPIGQHQLLMGEHIHGGFMWPRTGR